MIFEIGLLIYGLVVLVKGKLSAPGRRKCTGMPARVCGIICLIPVPLSMLVGMIAGGALAAQGGTQKDLENLQPKLMGIEIGLVIIAIIAVTVISGIYAKRQEIARAGGIVDIMPVEKLIPKK